MREIFEQRLYRVGTLHQVGVVVVDTLLDLKNSSSELGYVSGLISSEGMVKMASNIKRLEAYTHRIRRAVQPIPVFSATDVFSSDLYQRISTGRSPLPEEFEKCWETILTEGGVTQVYFTPRWRLSRGARDEYRVAAKLGLKIHELDINHHFLHPK